MAEEQISAVIGKQAYDDMERMLKLLDTAAQKIVDVNNLVKNASVEVKGAKSIEALATGTAKLQTETQQLTAAAVDYNKIAAQTDQLLKDISGSQGQNLRMYAQYKAELAANKEAQTALSKEYKAGKTTLEEYKSQMAALVGQEQAAKIAQAELTQTIKAVIKEEQAASGSTDQLAQRLGLLRDAYRKMSDEEKQSSGGKALLSAIQELDPAVKSLDASTGNFQRNVGNYPRTMNGAVAVLEKARGEMMQQLQVVDKSSDTYTVLSAQVDHLNTVLESNATKYLSARSASRELENVSRELAESLGLESEAFRTVSKVAGDYKNDVGDVQATIKNLSSDTQTLDGVIGAAQGLAGAFSVAEGAAALFGGESEAMAQTMQRLMALMTVMQGLQAVQNALQSESTAMMLLNNIQLKAKALWQGVVNFATTGNINLTAAQAAAQNTSTAATVSGTIALRAFRTALIGTGIGLVIVLLATAASAMDRYSISTDAAAGSTGNLADETDRLLKALDDTANATERAVNARAGGLDALQRELNLMEAQGASAESIQKKKQEIFREETENLRFRASMIAISIEKERDKNRNTAKLEQELADINKKGLDKISQQKVSAAEYQKRVNDKAEDENKKAAEKQQREQEKRAKELEALRERDAKAAAEILELSIKQQSDTYKEIADNEEKSLEIRLQANAKHYTLEAELVNAHAETEKAGKAKTAKELLLIEAKREDEITKLQTESGKARLEITKGYLDEQIQLRQAGVQRLIENIDSQEQQELRLLADGLRSQNLTVDQYEKEREKIQDKYNKKRAQGTIDYLSKEIDGLSQANADTLVLQKQLNDAQNTLYQLDAENFYKSAQEKQTAQKRLFNALVDLGKEVFNTLVAITNYDFEKELRGVDKQIENIDKVKDAEIKAVNASTLSQQEKQRKISEAEAQAQVKREAIEARKRQIQLQQARFEKAANIASIIGGTGVAIISILRDPTIPAPFKFPLAALAGAIGAVQLARAVAAPLPQYWKGRKGGPAEMAWVGERGSELIREKTGKTYLTPGVPTVTYLPAGADVITHDEVMAMAQHSTMRALAGTGRPVTPNSYAEELIRQYQLSNDRLAGLTEQVIAAINEKPTPHLEITERGIRQIIQNGDRWTEYLRSNL